MARERFYDERDFEDGNSPEDYYEFDPEDDWTDGEAPIEKVASLEDLFRRQTLRPITQRMHGGS